MPVPVPTRTLGSSDLTVTALGLGCLSLSGTYGTSDDQLGYEFLQFALASGVNFLDTADMYGWGQNEELIGRAISGYPTVVVATKFGQVRLSSGDLAVNGRPEHVVASCDASLLRLRRDVIDLYYLIRVDPQVPIEETVGAMSNLVAAGKVRHIGLSEAHPDTIRRAHRVHPIAAVQSEYSLLYRTQAEETIATTRELGIGYVAYSPLGRSLLTGAVNAETDVAGDRRAHHPRFQGANFAQNRALTRHLQLHAQDKGCTPGQLALAWLLAKGRDIIPIPGTKRKDHFQENMGALRIDLTTDDLARLEAVFKPGAGHGSRYPAVSMKDVYL